MIYTSLPIWFQNALLAILGTCAFILASILVAVVVSLIWQAVE